MLKRAGIVAGWALILLGVLSIGTYAWGVIGVLGEADRSWIFWGLVFLFLGLYLIRAGIGILDGVGASLPWW